MLSIARNAFTFTVLCLLSSSLAFGSVISGDADGPQGEGCFNCGFIGIHELNIVLGAWNQFVPPADPLADWSGDGYVGIDDLSAVLSEWNAGTPPGRIGVGCGVDHNCDGFVGITELNLVLGDWNSPVPPANPLADHSDDAYIGIDDLNAVLSNWNAGTPPGELFGCLNDLGSDGCGGDGFVGIDDLNLVLGNWNFNVPPANPGADHSGPGYIGIDDLNWVLSNWNAGTPPTTNAVPEPAGLALLGLGSMILLRQRGESS